MKHDFKIIAILIFLFFISQIVGLLFIAGDIEQIVLPEFNQTQSIVVHQDTSIGERPDLEGSQSFIYMTLVIFFGTLFLLLLIKLRAQTIWKGWYFFAVLVALMISFGVYFNSYISFIIALILALIKILKPNVYFHNLTEILIYTGIALVFVPLFSLFWISMLLILISFYDMYAVWKSKHMIKLAKFTTESKLFAGFNINYGMSKGKVEIVSKATKKSHKSAILGGGDVFFPLLFTGVVMENLVKNNFSLINSFLISLIVVITSTIALSVLFYYSKKGKFYPAMPFLSIGCFIGLGLVWLITFLL